MSSSGLPMRHFLAAHADAFILEGLISHLKEQHNSVNSAPSSGDHKGKLSHELIAGAAAYEATKAYNKHCEKHGKPVDHAHGKQLIGGIAGGIVDKLAETKGLDKVEKHKAKKDAEQQAHSYYDKELH
ncbi:hypothetical protein BCR43DRAFT_520755 [Syncephalastrum racemosum]|uniref:CipC-like antibiotic response protein n=1 Tax=Syncephalastrum racemosum TaxID=13706 RepID=A0A1X2HVL2_SYNRA|nr:hypothetical protein BCR43DRAFT_520755 [Syncephalastrum racemosum]